MLNKLANAVLSTAVIAMIAVSPSPSTAVEQAPYDVLDSADGVEIRRYPETIVAQTVVEAEDRQSAASKGFMPLAGYIFGQNQGGEKIAMTAPVTTGPVEPEVTTAQANGDGKFTVQFVMPAKWTMETLPKPMNPKVSLKTLPLRYIVATGMVGKRTPQQIAKLEAKVSQFIENRKLMTSGGLVSAGYNGPNTPEEKRRWEVLQQVTAPQ